MGADDHAKHGPVGARGLSDFPPVLTFEAPTLGHSAEAWLLLDVPRHLGFQSNAARHEAVVISLWQELGGWLTRQRI